MQRCAEGTRARKAATPGKHREKSASVCLAKLEIEIKAYLAAMGKGCRPSVQLSEQQAHPSMVTPPADQDPGYLHPVQPLRDQLCEPARAVCMQQTWVVLSCLKCMMCTMGLSTVAATLQADLAASALWRHCQGHNKARPCQALQGSLGSAPPMAPPHAEIRPSFTACASAGRRLMCSQTGKAA